MMSSDNVWSADNQQVRKKQGIPDEYFAGFVDGEGCFYVGFSKRIDLPLQWQVITEFHLSQNPGGKNILEAFSARIGCGYIKRNHPKSSRDKSWVLIVKDRKDLEEKLIPFFMKHPLHSAKFEDFRIFVQVLDIILRGEHLKREGFKRIVELVFQSPKTGLKKYSREILMRS